MTRSARKQRGESDSPAPQGEACRRRTFLARALAWAPCAIAAGNVGCTHLVRSVRVRPGKVLELPLRDVPELESVGGRVKLLVGRDGALFVERTGVGYRAISGVCTHQGCIVEPAGDGFSCPCHGSRFNATGEPTAPPARRALGSFPVTVAGDVLRVQMSGGDAAARGGTS